MNSVAFVDHLLRNHDQVITDIQDESKSRFITSTCIKVFLCLSAFYGLIMGSQNLVHGGIDGWKYTLAAGIKLPMLFLFTLAICLPLFYVLNVSIGPRTRFQTVLGLLMSSIAVTSIVLISCAPIVLFFMLSTKSYPFIILLNVIVFTGAGGYGVRFLGKGMHSLMPEAEIKVEPEQAKQGVSTIMQFWLVTYGLVGTQMAWIMRPFIGSPKPFSFFRALESNFYLDLFHVIRQLMGL